MSTTWDSATQTVTITFDRPLEEAVLSVSNWTVHYAGSFDTPASAVSEGSTVMLGMSSSMSPTFVQYSPPPFDVVGTNGLEVQAFFVPV